MSHRALWGFWLFFDQQRKQKRNEDPGHRRFPFLCKIWYAPKPDFNHTGRAETISELILTRASPIIFDFLIGINSSKTDSSHLSLRRAKPENYWKRLLIQGRAYSAIKSANFGQKLKGRLLKGSFDKACALT